MNPAEKPSTSPKVRHNGWTPERRRQFLQFLAIRGAVRRACTRVGLSRQAAYKLRQRDPAFAQEWHEALRMAHDANAESSLLAALPEELFRTLSQASTACKLDGHGGRMTGLPPAPY